MRQADNERLTRVGKGTPMGELLRRYWHPVAPVNELTEEKPTKSVTLLGEKLTVYRLPAGPGQPKVRYGLIAERCAHRHASLTFGRVESDGIRCPYHGWKYDTAGKCIEQPAEPKQFTDVKIAGYPVERLAGLLWAYMGPLPAPLLPRWDVLAREDGKRWLTIESVINCNFMQPMENSVDPSHLYWLHGYTYGSGHLAARPYAEKHDFIRWEYGIQKRRTTPGKNPGEPEHVDEHPILFPATLRHVSSADRGKGGPPRHRHNLQIRVPLDDTHTMVYRVNFVPNDTDHSPVDADPPFEYRPNKDANGVYDMSIVGAQDSMAWETQGPIADRTTEYLGAADKGLVMLRKLYMEQMEIVEKGGEPMGVIRDPAKNKVIDIPVVNERIGLPRKKEMSDGARAEAT